MAESNSLTFTGRLRSVKFALRGILVMLKTQHNAWLHAVATVAVIGMGLLVRLTDSDGDGLTDGWEIGLGRFSIIAGIFNWAQARADAHARGGELACFPTADRWNRAMEPLGADALDNYTGLWIGASDATTEGTWLWVNGEAFSHSLWATGKPSTLPGNTLDYAEVSGGDGAVIQRFYSTREVPKQFLRVEDDGS